MKIANLNEKSGKVELQGFVHEFRDMGGLKFLQLRDHSGTIQVTIVKNKVSEEVLDAVKGLTNESSVIVKGEVKTNEKAASGLEIIPENILVVSKAEPELPISVNEKGITTGQSTRLDWRSLDLRKPRMQAIFTVQSAILEGMRKWLLDNEYRQVFTPCLLGVASESGSEVFPVVYFDKEAFLRQDPQLHRQLSVAGGITKVFDIGPAWRAEQSHTTKHLCEHRVCAVETGFIKDERDVERIEEQVVISALTNVKEKCANELKLLNVEVKIPKAPFPEFCFPELYDILAKKGKKLEHGSDMDTEAEKILWEHVKEEYGVEFYWVNRFPFKIKPFYVMRVDEEPDRARSIDLYFKGLELSSGGQREHRYEKIIEQVKEKGMNPESVEWFTKFFKYGVPTHGGFAIGIERITQSLLNVENIRDCVLFPRDPDRLVP
ncbi:aspartate--tRNA(Asn) ligase [Candidatus Woesearchaeota archaeon CG10_big_fil_rev_8_21_14_0_10_30_7]|nr:MAG: aspartate--tRNA(Asn) ligase [Candidatus Woesearchaeota archaeon CG10_big_fil_rev_8_21_14_0_10_30_7]